MAATRIFPFDPESDTEKLLDEAVSHPAIALIGGRRYRVTAEPLDRDKSREPMINYDPEKAIAALKSLSGLLQGVDIVELKRELREERGQFTEYRPYDFPEVLPLGAVRPEPNEDPFKNYDPEKARQAMQRVFGLFKGVDVAALQADIRAERGQIGESDGID